MNEIMEAALKFADRSWSAIGKLLVFAVVVGMSFNFSAVLDFTKELFVPKASSNSAMVGSVEEKEMQTQIDSAWNTLYYVTPIDCLDHLRTVSLELNDKNSDLYDVNPNRSKARFKVKGVPVETRCIAADPHSVVAIYAGGPDEKEVYDAVNLVYNKINQIEAQSSKISRENFKYNPESQSHHYYYYTDYSESTADVEKYIDTELVDKRHYLKREYDLDDVRKITYRGLFAFMIIHLPLREESETAEPSEGGKLLVDLMTYENENSDNEYKNFKDRKILKFIW